MGEEEHADRQRRLRIWLLGVAPPLIMIALSIGLQIGALFFFAFLWAVVLAAISLGFSSRPQARPSPERAALPQPAPPPSTEEISSAMVRVSSVKAEYGSLLSDIVYRIENSALFDDAAPLTREFQLALLRWDDVQATGDAATLQRVSGEVELAFRTAKSNAETLGLSHLPTKARPTAQKALKAAHLAQGAGTRNEREAALAQVARLLDSIALYYLPSPDEVPRLTGGVRRELDA